MRLIPFLPWNLPSYGTLCLLPPPILQSTFWYFLATSTSTTWTWSRMRKIYQQIRTEICKATWYGQNDAQASKSWLNANWIRKARLEQKGAKKSLTLNRLCPNSTFPGRGKLELWTWIFLFPKAKHGSRRDTAGACSQQASHISSPTGASTLRPLNEKFQWKVPYNLHCLKSASFWDNFYTVKIPPFEGIVLGVLTNTYGCITTTTITI